MRLVMRCYNSSYKSLSREREREERERERERESERERGGGRGVEALMGEGVRR